MARPRKRAETELSKFLDAALKRKGLNNAEFSRKVGIKPSSLSDLKLRREAAAPDRAMARKWAEALGLSADEEHDLFELLQLVHSPGYVQELVTRLRTTPKIGWAAEPPKDYET